MIANFSCEKERLLYVQKITRANYFLSATAFDSPIHNNIEKRCYAIAPPHIIALYLDDRTKGHTEVRQRGISFDQHY
jgi:hypothetical protein